MTDAAHDATAAAIGRSALRKAAIRLLPLLGVGYGVAYMDRANISFAALQMNVDLHFSAAVYGLGAGLFFISYAALELPSNLALVRFGARRWIARIMITWGGLAVMMMFVSTPTQFYVMRFLLGAAESGFFPGVIFYLTQWFPADQRAKAISRFYIAYPLSTVIMGALAGWLLGLRGTLGLAGWQWLFLVEGSPAILLSLVFLIALPDSPATAKWLTSAERDWITGRLAAEQAARGPADHRLRAIAANPAVWMLGLASFGIQFTAYSLSLSAPAVLQEATHLSAGKVGGLMSMIALVGVAAMLFAAGSSDRAQERIWHAVVPQGLIVIGFLVCGLVGGPIALVGAYAVIALCQYAVQSSLWAIPGDLLSGRSAAAAVAGIGAISMTGGFLGPYAFGLVRQATGDYRHGLLALTVPSLLAVVFILLLRGRRGAAKAGEAKGVVARKG